MTVFLIVMIPCKFKSKIKKVYSTNVQFNIFVSMIRIDV